MQDPLDVLLMKLGDPDWHIRCEAIKALGVLSTSSGTPG